MTVPTPTPDGGPTPTRDATERPPAPTACWERSEVVAAQRLARWATLRPSWASVEAGNHGGHR